MNGDASTFLLLQTAYLTGWAVAAPIGPVNLEIMRRVLRHGLRAGILLGMGACCIDGIYLLLFSAGLGTILQVGSVQRVFFFLGGGFLCWLGGLAIWEARRLHNPLADAAQPHLPQADPAAASDRPWRHYLVGLGMTATNPMTIAFWSALSLKFVDLQAGQRLMASVVLMGGCFSWVLTVTLATAFARRYVGGRTFMAANILGGVVVLWFGLRFLWRGWVG